ncbi:GGDEF domain-containing protein [Porticoccus sp. W117]|uniref:GGDEF domain-containing protein n=1 Tax=Porticoccus sp. W117 TaxID=3054777 RepID=UPI002597C6B2|nr:GGDEF domain-containing protein [Porticoccus sp. W117]MDM3871472.1 GGDEF domain-containing protein [Porticoccus sp. W117]
MSADRDFSLQQGRQQDHQSEHQQQALNDLRREELLLNLPLCLTFTALFTLGYAAWFYFGGLNVFAVVLTTIGASAVVLLVLCSHITKATLLPMQLLFGVLMVIACQAIVALCPVGETGIVGPLAIVPAIIVVCGYRLAAGLLTLNLLLLIGLFNGWLQWQTASYSSEMEMAMVAGYSAMALFLLVVDFYRERSRARLVGVSEKFSRSATQDELSGLPNRREMERLLGGCINRYHLSGEMFSVMICDIDNFKQFNDSFGHQFGDRTVKAVSGALQRGLRADDVVARWGSDEFLVLLSGQKIEAAHQVAERLRRNVSALQLEESGEIQNITMSFGLACMEGHEGADDLVSTADRGLYQAKQMGRDMVVAG